MLEGLKLCLLNENNEVVHAFEMKFAKELASDMLWRFKRDLRFSHEYNIDNFIKFYNDNFFVSGNRETKLMDLYENEDGYPVEYKLFNYNKTLAIVDEEGYFSIVNPEHIFYNYKPKKMQTTQGYTQRVYRPRHTTGFYNRGMSIKVKKNDARLEEAKGDLKELGIRVVKPISWSKSYKDPWSTERYSRHSSGWKSQKRKHQYKCKDVA